MTTVVRQGRRGGAGAGPREENSSFEELISLYLIGRIARDKSANRPDPVRGRPTDTGRKRLEVSVMRVE